MNKRNNCFVALLIVTLIEKYNENRQVKNDIVIEPYELYFILLLSNVFQVRIFSYQMCTLLCFARAKCHQLPDTTIVLEREMVKAGNQQNLGA